MQLQSFGLWYSFGGLFRYNFLNPGLFMRDSSFLLGIALLFLKQEKMYTELKANIDE